MRNDHNFYFGSFYFEILPFLNNVKTNCIFLKHHQIGRSKDYGVFAGEVPYCNARPWGEKLPCFLRTPGWSTGNFFQFSSFFFLSNIFYYYFCLFQPVNESNYDICIIWYSIKWWVELVIWAVQGICLHPQQL